MRSLRDGSATIVMQRGLIVSGVVANADGKPLGDALVVRGDDPYFEHGSQEVRTHADGSYQLPPQLAGPLTLTVVAPGWAPDQRKLDVAPDKLQADFEFQRGNTIRIHITDESGVAIPEVFVGLARWRGNRGLYNAVHPNVLPTKIPNQSDENGVYEWTWSPVDDVSYGFYKEGYLEAELVAGPGEHFVKLRKR